MKTENAWGRKNYQNKFEEKMPKQGRDGMTNKKDNNDLWKGQYWQITGKNSRTSE